MPVYCFIEDVAASGGYWLSAAEEIYATESTVKEQSYFVQFRQ